METGLAFWIKDQSVLLAVAVPVVLLAAASHPVVIQAVSKFPGVTSAPAIGCRLEAKCAIITESRRAVLPANGPYTLVTSFTRLVAKPGIILLVRGALHGLAHVPGVTFTITIRLLLI
jgi:hypothetical protein